MLAGMQASGDNLSDQQIAAVVNDVRSYFGNRLKGEVKAADASVATIACERLLRSE